MEKLAKYGLDKFVSALYYKNSGHRLIELNKLNFKELLLLAKHFDVDEIYTKSEPEIIVDINETIDAELNSITELNTPKNGSYYDWHLSFRKEKNCEIDPPKAIKNKLGIESIKFKSYLKTWKKKNLPEAQH